MNKRLTVAVLLALLPLSLQISAQDVPADKSSSIVKNHRKETLPVARTAADGVQAVDLDEASAAHDVVLPQQPVHMTADKVLVRGKDGFVAGRGNVDIMRGMDEIHANTIEGNTKSQVYHTAGKAVYLNSTMALETTGLTYSGTGPGATMDTVQGFMDSMTYIRGTGAEMYDGTGYVRHGLITTPHAVAKTPDYYITGDDIHIYPGEKFTAENTKLWFKNICLFTYGHYEGRLDKERNQKPWIFSLLPRPTYNNDNGIGLRGDARFPMNQNGDLYMDVNYAIYSKEGFKPGLKVGKRTPVGTFTFGYSKEESTDNDDHIWATRWPELRYYMPRIYAGSSGIYVDGSASWGRWSEGEREGVHKGFRTELTHNPIHLWSKANLRFFTGYRKDLYSYRDAVRKDPYWGVILNQGINSRLWTSFWYKKHNLSGYTPYRFDTIDHPRQKGFSVGYVLTPLDTIMFTFNKNLDNGNIDDRNFTWIRDLHSFIATVTYKQVDKEWEVQLISKDLDF